MIININLFVYVNICFVLLYSFFQLVITDDNFENVVNAIRIGTQQLFDKLGTEPDRKE